MISLPPKQIKDFILANTSVSQPPHTPEIKLHLADEAHDLWHKTEEQLEAIGLPPPFWAFAWAGGQGLARYILDHPEIVTGKTVLDLASGSGLVAIAAMKAQAKNAIANDIDPFSRFACLLNSTLNQVAVKFCDTDFCHTNTLPFERFELLLAGDVFYDQTMAKQIFPLLHLAAQQGKTVLVGDPGRAYLPKDKMKYITEYCVPVTKILEDSEVKHTSIWQVL